MDLYKEYSIQPPEKDCRDCGRLNYLNARTCWWCGCSDPCHSDAFRKFYNVDVG